jgi:nitrate/TMAO reductase-like tetraheme cytochrome c subunit
MMLHVIKKYHILLLITSIISTIAWFNLPKIAPYYAQMTKERLGLHVDLQPKAQKEAHFVGSSECKTCHKEEHHDWKSSLHSKMIQNIQKDPSAVLADFKILPLDADFTLKEALYSVGSKFKQRYMIPAEIEGKKDFRLGNYQWNLESKKWQSFKPYKYWYKDAYSNDNKVFPTSNACDGCHFVGYMSTSKRVEPSISCESCHGAGSLHSKNPQSPMYKASLSDPIRSNEVCLQCHMRNRDYRLLDKNMTVKQLSKDAKDYPQGYEAGKPLINYKLPAPFEHGKESKEFWANGTAKKNRSQGNEYIHDTMYAHGVTCINCHNPHTLTNTAQKPEGNDACMKCHSFAGLIGPHQKTLEAHTHHKAKSKGSLCIECHMPKTGRHTSKSPLTVRSHRFKFTSPSETKTYNMPPETNACYHCHQNKTLDTLQESLKAWGQVSWEYP